MADYLAVLKAAKRVVWMAVMKEGQRADRRALRKVSRWAVMMVYNMAD
jgi:hypothetical protein